MQVINAQQRLETSNQTLEESRSSGLSPEPPGTGANNINSPEQLNENY
jgi:hypothetical protein